MPPTPATIQHANFFQFARTESLELKRLRSRMFLLVTSGSVRVQVCEHTGLYNAGDWLLTPWLPHMIFQTRKNQAATVGTIHLAPECADMKIGHPPPAHTTETGIGSLPLLDESGNAVPEHFVRGSAGGSPLFHAALAILGRWRESPPAPWERRIQTAFLITNLVRALGQEDEQERTRTLPRAVNSALLWAKLHPSTPLTLDVLAKAAEVHAATLHRHFHDAFGVSPLRYLSRRRIESAAELLTGTNHSVQEIAAAIGYSDSLHFSKVFKAQYGVSPTKYRTRHSHLAGMALS